MPIYKSYAYSSRHRNQGKHTLAVLLAMVALTIGAPRIARSDVGPFDFKSREVQEGRHFAQRIIATLTVGKSTGQGTYDFSFNLPQGRGVTPSLGLSYASSAGPSEAGDGWSLTVPMIERSFEHGVPTFQDALDTFRYREGHNSRDLVPTGEILNGWFVFREKTEVSHSLYLTMDNRWRVLRVDGTRVDLGETASARRGRNGRLTRPDTAAWLVTRLTDTHGNQATFTYESGRGQEALLSRIEYSGNPSVGLLPQYRVELDWASHFGPADARIVSHRKGYSEFFGRERLGTVTISANPLDTTGNPAKVPASSPLSLVYTLTHESTSATAPAFRLTSIQVANQPPMEFEYETPWPTGMSIDTIETWHAALDPVVMPATLGQTNTDQDDVTRTFTTFADVHGDGRPDLLDTHTLCENNEWIVWRNEGDAFVRETWNAPDLPAGARRDKCAVRLSEKIGDETFTWQEFVDFTGDSLPDLAFWDAATMFICRGNGSGFDPCTVWGPLPSGVTAGTFRRESSQFANLSITDIELIDFNGDGFVDRVSTLTGTSIINVVLNDHGTGWGTLTSHAIPDCGIPGIPACIRVSERIAQSGPNRRMLVETRDINGDGLPDHLSTSLLTGIVQVAWGTGGDFGTPTPIPNGPTSLGLGRESSGGDYRASEDLIDVNGDGLPDIVELVPSPLELRVRYNVGGSWEAAVHSHPVPFDPGVNSYYARSLSNLVAVDDENAELRSTLLDISGDGIPELISARIDNAGLPFGHIRVTRLPYRSPRLLLVASSLQNNSTSRMSYAAQGGLPFPLHTVVATRRERSPVYIGESPEQTSLETTYTYVDPVYDRAAREFRGFRQAFENNLVYGKTVATTFLTGEHTAGIAESETTANVTAAGVPVTVVKEYSEVPLGGGSVFVRLDSHQVLDGTLFNWRVRETSYSDYAFGVARSVVDTDPLHPAAQTTTLVEQVVRRDSEHLLVLTSRVTGMHQGSIASETTNYYDDRFNHGAVPTRGNPVRSRIRRSFLVGVDHEAQFDDETGPGTGALVAYVDPGGTTITYSYDLGYRQYPTAETSPIGTTYRSYHVLFGTVADACGPQFLGATYRCSRTEVDHLGRLSARHVPVIQGGAFTMSRMEEMSYDTTTYPILMRVTLRPGAPDAARALSYIDGFGNLVQSRVEETTGVFRVVDSAADAHGRLRWTSQPRRENGTAYHATFDPGRFANRFSHDYVRKAVERRLFPRDEDDPLPQATSSRVHEGSRIVETDELGRVTQYVLDGFGRTTDRIHVATTGNAVFHLAYDRNGNIESVTDPNGLATIYQYDDHGWLLSVRHSDNALHQFLHNERGDVVEHTDPRGVVNRVEYDGTGRPFQVHTIASVSGVPNVDETTTYYDASSPAQLGWVASRTANGITHSTVYDAGGRPETMTMSSPIGTATVTQSFTYDGRLDRIVYGDGWSVKYDYYLDGSAKRVTDEVNERALGETLLDDNGRPSTISSPLGLEHSFSYDARGRIVQTTSANLAYGSDALVDDEFRWTDASELHQLVRHGLAPGLVPRSAPDTYTVSRDHFGRLTGMTENGSPFGTYTYDLGGRMLTLDEGNGTFAYTYSNDRMMRRMSSIDQVRYVYDANGNATVERLSGSANRVRTLTWDASNRLDKLELSNAQGKSALYYDYVGGDLAKILRKDASPDIKETLLLGNLVRFDSSTEQYTDRVWLGPTLLCERRSGTIEYLHRSLGGSVAAVTDENGDVLRQEEYYPYGRTSASWGQSDHEHGFHGLRRDDLYVTGPRPYDHESGRWLARDPIAHDPDAWSSMRELDSYGYAYARPLEFRDPSGLQPVETGDWYVEGNEVPEGQIVDSNGRLVQLDPNIPVEVQLMQMNTIEVPDVDLEAAVEAVVPYVPFVGPIVDIANGNIKEGLIGLALDVAAGPVLSKAGKLGKAYIKSRRVAAAACFAAGTPVHTANGPKAIEEVQLGDLVSCSDTLGVWTLCNVTKTLVFKHKGDVVTLSVNGESLRVTPDHPFWVRSGQDLALRERPHHLGADEAVANERGRWVKAGDLRVGDVLETRSDTAEVAHVARAPGTLEVFNFVVDDKHTFTVGQQGLLVHNKPMATATAKTMMAAAVLPSSLKCYGKCENFATALMRSLKTLGVKGQVVGYKYGGGMMPFSKQFGKLGDKNQWHYFVRVGDTVFDNARPQGMPYAQFVDDMGLDRVEKLADDMIEASF